MVTIRASLKSCGSSPRSQNVGKDQAAEEGVTSIQTSAGLPSRPAALLFAMAPTADLSSLNVGARLSSEWIGL